MSYHHLNIIVAVQARMNSSRLPGKPLRLLEGKVLIEHLFARLSQSQKISLIVAATTDTSKDDELIKFLETAEIPYYRGSETDIVQRLYGTAHLFKADILVRVWGDCPLVDAEVIDQMIDRLIHENADYVTNSFPASFPFGLNAEIYTCKTLERLLLTDDLFYREFPFEWIKDSGQFKWLNHSYSKDVSHFNLTIDYPEDLAVVAEVIRHFKHAQKPMTVDNLVEYCESHAEIFDKNRSLKRNIEYKEQLHLHHDQRTKKEI